MNSIILDNKFKLYTPDNSPNLMWAIANGFEEINDKNGVNESNRLLYVSDYNNTICPAIRPGLAIADYTEADIRDLFSRIVSLFPISEATFNSRHRHLILDPLEWFNEHYVNSEDRDWGAFYKFDDKGLGLDVALSRVRRTFTDREALILKHELLDDMSHISGEYVGIAICEYAAARLNESAGLYYNDIYPMLTHTKEYLMRLGVNTTKLHKNELKLSGKTLNAPRIIPILDILRDSLIKRMNYIESKMQFPYSDATGHIYSSVLELPVVCREDDFTRRSGADNISDAARELFKDKLQINENRMSGISELMFRDSELFAEEKDPTCYTCRRDCATELSIAFEEERYGLAYLQYYIGHQIEDKRFRRNDFTDEYYLHKMKKLIEKSHRVNRL